MAEETAAERAELLVRHQPCLRYDAVEIYFADKADEWTLNPANRLQRRDGVVVGVADGLSLDSLGERYPDGVTAAPEDVIACARPGDVVDYGAQYRRLRAGDQSLRNAVYGRAVDGRGGVWLQYWFWYFLNDYQLAFGIDVHEGDWEMVQLFLPDGADEPTDVLYAQHTYCELRSWEQVRRLSTELAEEERPPEPGAEHRPLVYVGRGSHASFFEPGYHETDFYDLCDGLQRAKTATTLIDVTTAPPWLRWPGRWGSADLQYKGPTAPCRHAQWDDPETLRRSARVVRRPPAPGAPVLAAHDRDGRLAVTFDAAPCPVPLAQLIVTVNCSDDKADPPHVVRVGVADVVRGTLDLTVSLDRRKHYDVRIAGVDRDGRPSLAQIFLFEPPHPLRALVRRITSAVGRLVYRVRLLLGIDHGRPSDAPLA